MGRLSLYELLSTVAALATLTPDSSASPEISEEEWDKAKGVIETLAQFDPSLRL